MKVKIHLHPVKYRKKPEDYEIVKINNSISEYWRELDIEEFFDRVGKQGQTFLPAKMKGVRNKKNFVSQQIFALDFDEGFSVTEFWDRAEKYKVRPFFMYETLSCSQDIYKFRAVFMNDCLIEDSDIAEIMLILLLKIFPEADEACKDCSRMFFGGKKKIYCNENNTINLFDVSQGAQAYIRKCSGDNYARDIKRFADSLKIAVHNNNLCILRMWNPDEEEMEGFKAKTTNKIVYAPEPSIFYVIETTPEHSSSIHGRRKSIKDCTKIRSINEKVLMNTCDLYKDYTQHDLHHNLKFMLLSNLIHIKGGEKLFFKYLDEHREKWEQDLRYIKNLAYNPMGCEKANCPYYDKCGAKSLVSKLTQKIRKVKDFTYGNIEESREKLELYMKESVLQSQPGITLIQAQTALGKTTAYCDLVEQYNDRISFMIVVPTNKLQNEVAHELKLKGIDVYTTPNLKDLLRKMNFTELLSEVELLYEQGFGYKVKERVNYLCLNSKACLWDMLCQCIIRVEEEHEQEFIELSGGKIPLDIYRAFSTSRRKHLRKSEKKDEVEYFSDYGYKFSLDAEIKIGKGRGVKSKIKTPVPNIFRMFILYEDFRNLFSARKQSAYSHENMIRIINDCGDIGFSDEDEYVLEGLFGINLAICITKLLNDILKGCTQDEIKDMDTDIENLIKNILKWPGIYSRCELIALLSEIEVPGIYIKEYGVDRSLYVLKYYAHVLKGISDRISSKYFLFSYIIKAVLLNSHGDKSAWKQIKKEMAAIKTEIVKKTDYLYLNGVSEMIEEKECLSTKRQEYIYSIVQKKLIMLQMK